MEDSPDQPLACLGHPGGQDVGSLQDAALQFGHGVGPERHGARHHEEQHHPQGPDVHEDADVVLVPKELRRGVRRRAAERVEGLVAAAQRAKAKVPDLDTGAASVEDIFGLQVAVDDVVFVLCECKEKLLLSKGHTHMDRMENVSVQQVNILSLTVFVYS